MLCTNVKLYHALRKLQSLRTKCRIEYFGADLRQMALPSKGTEKNAQRAASQSTFFNKCLLKSRRAVCEEHGGSKKTSHFRYKFTNEETIYETDGQLKNI